MLAKPAASYRSQFAHLAEVARLAAVCHEALSVTASSDSSVSVSEVVAKITRAKVRSDQILQALASTTIRCVVPWLSQASCICVLM